VFKSIVVLQKLFPAHPPPFENHVKNRHNPPEPKQHSKENKKQRQVNPD